MSETNNENAKTAEPPVTTVTTTKKTGLGIKIWLLATNFFQLVIIIMLVMFMQTREMLENRKIIQVENARALDSLGVLSNEARCRMRDAWEKAQYYNEPNIFVNADCPYDPKK